MRERILAPAHRTNMLISFNWLRDYVDLPDTLDSHELAERFTVTTAEVEGVHSIKVDAHGLVAARIQEVGELRGAPRRRIVTLDTGKGRTIQTVSAAPVLPIGATVVYAPDGASVGTMPRIGTAHVQGQTSSGMIPPGEALGIELASQEAVLMGEPVAAGTPLPRTLFDDWLMEVDNKSITHRPDLWGHYGIAREIAALFHLPLKPLPVTPLEELLAGEKEIPIHLAAPDACRRYSGILLEGVPTQPAPLWMQLRLGHVGMRPISGLVDLTNYVMADLGQPMHAFDADKVDAIEVDWAADSELFRTLDGVDRRLTARELMIRCHGRSIALAGVMGGADTEVSSATRALLLESANFDPATIRRTAIRLGLRTDASGRFEKSLDPHHTVLGIQRFVYLARQMYPNLSLASRLSDAYASPAVKRSIAVRPRHVARVIGTSISADEATDRLAPLEFRVDEHEGVWRVKVPSFRAGKDVTIEADVIEELARTIGYGAIEPVLPRVSMRRFPLNTMHELERRTIEYFTGARNFVELHGYLWLDATWIQQLGAELGEGIRVTNPPAEGLDQLRSTLMPGLLAAVNRNRFHFPSLALMEVGSVFEKRPRSDGESRHLALVLARRGRQLEGRLFAELKAALEGWGWERFARDVTFTRTTARATHPWEHASNIAAVEIDRRRVGLVSVISLTMRQAMDEHLSAWSLAWAEVCLDELADLAPRTEQRGTIPPYPHVELDFSFLVPVARAYQEVSTGLAEFSDSLLRNLRFLGSFEGGAVPSGHRSLTVRATLGRDDRTLVDADLRSFREAFETHLTTCGYQVRGS